MRLSVSQCSLVAIIKDRQAVRPGTGTGVVGRNYTYQLLGGASLLYSAPPHSTTLALRAGNVTQPGALQYLNNCSGCHRSDGQGAERTFPALARSSSVIATDVTSLIRIVLQGAAMPATLQVPSALVMPGFAWRLNDEDVANVPSFVRSSWTNQAGPVTPNEVAKVRAALGQTLLVKRD